MFEFVGEMLALRNRLPGRWQPEAKDKERGSFPNALHDSSAVAGR